MAISGLHCNRCESLWTARSGLTAVAFACGGRQCPTVGSARLCGLGRLARRERRKGYRINAHGNDGARSRVISARLDTRHNAPRGSHRGASQLSS